jgi:hypothetical protein
LRRLCSKLSVKKQCGMSEDFDFSIPDPGGLTRGRFSYFPVVPGRLEFAAELRRTILETSPQVVAVELPQFLEDGYQRAVDRLPQMSVLLYTASSTENDEAVYVTVEPTDPFTEAIRSGLEQRAEIVFLEPATVERPHLADRYPDPLSIRHIGMERYVEAYRVYPQERSDEITTLAQAMAWKLQGVDPLANVLVVVSLNMLDALLDAMEEPQVNPRRGTATPLVELLNPHPDCLAEITVEYPFLQERYERYRLDMGRAELLDRPRCQLEVLREAEKAYIANTGDKIEHWQRRMMARFTRNLAAVEGQLAAGLFDLTVAARSIVDDNFAWEVWEAAGRYTPQQADSELETVNLSGEEVFLHTRKLRLRRRMPRPKQRAKPAGMRDRKKEKTPGEWARALNGQSICSYPPEDIVIEDYGRFLKRKAKSILSEERSRVEPFTTSLLDGIDLRETIRNWHESKIYVRQLERIRGDVGSVVVIFDEDRTGRYTYLTTWLGENQNESDMAFYSTHPFDHMVGPGIGRAEYGGFLMTLPPRRMYDVWSDSDYDSAETKPERPKPERLLMAALDYSVERFVVYVAARPPRSTFRTLAGRLNRKIIYIPIGQLSPSKMKNLRVVHVLDSYERRKTAKDYIW